MRMTTQCLACHDIFFLAVATLPPRLRLGFQASFVCSLHQLQLYHVCTYVPVLETSLAESAIILGGWLLLVGGVEKHQAFMF